jgi:biotin carboxyl carrier protein
MEVWLEVQGKKYKVHTQWLQQQLWVHVNGKTYVVDPQGPGRKSGSRSGSIASSDTIKAPMPGKITKIFVKSGDSTQKGQALIVMEAMKMEYTLKAELDGQIKMVEVQVGDQVPLGKTLIKIEPGT